MMRDFFYTLPTNILRAFSGRNLLWHLFAIGATLLIIISGFDWTYFKATRSFAPYLFPAVILGWRVPVILPIVLFTVSLVRKDIRVICSAYAIAQASLIGLLISSFYKAITGRPGLRYSTRTMIDTSHQFHFGFLKGGVFFGWPSSHTAIAFAMSVAIWTLYPNSKMVRCVALLYAFYIGIGVSMTIHWFSDYVTGAIIGAAIGTTVGNAFKKRLVS